MKWEVASALPATKCIFSSGAEFGTHQARGGSWQGPGVQQGRSRLLVLAPQQVDLQALSTLAHIPYCLQIAECISQGKCSPARRCDSRPCASLAKLIATTRTSNVSLCIALGHCWSYLKRAHGAPLRYQHCVKVPSIGCVLWGMSRLCAGVNYNKKNANIRELKAYEQAWSVEVRCLPAQHVNLCRHLLFHRLPGTHICMHVLTSDPRFWL